MNTSISKSAILLGRTAPTSCVNRSQMLEKTQSSDTRIETRIETRSMSHRLLDRPNPLYPEPKISLVVPPRIFLSSRDPQALKRRSPILCSKPPNDRHDCTCDDDIHVCPQQNHRDPMTASLTGIDLPAPATALSHPTQCYYL